MILPPRTSTLPKAPPGQLHLRWLFVAFLLAALWWLAAKMWLLWIVLVWIVISIGLYGLFAIAAGTAQPPERRYARHSPANRSSWLDLNWYYLITFVYLPVFRIWWYCTLELEAFDPAHVDELAVFVVWASTEDMRLVGGITNAVAILYFLMQALLHVRASGRPNRLQWIAFIMTLDYLLIRQPNLVGYVYTLRALLFGSPFE